MAGTLYYRGLTYGAWEAFRTVIPEPQNRIPVTWKAIPFAFLVCVPSLFMAYLVRRPGTHLIRLLLLPTIIFVCFGTAYRFVWTIPEINVYNWGQCLVAHVFVGKALEFAFSKEGRRKNGEPWSSSSSQRKKHGQANGTATVTERVTKASFLPPWLYDALEISFELRGVGWDFGKGVHIPKDVRPQERHLFLRATFLSFLRNYLLLDFLESLVKIFPGVGTPQGGSMFYSNLPPLQRYTISTIIHLLTGSALLSGFIMVYDLITLVSVGILGSSPSTWPPAMDDPWSSDSMHDFWSKRWHQFLRRTFMVYGGYPGKWLLGDFGMVQGAFLASGLYHECGIYAMGRGLDYRVILFFSLQGPLLIIEKLWKRVTGRRVGGWVGRLWVYFNVFVLGQSLVDSWHVRGLGGALVIPPVFSPMRWLIPALQQPVLHQWLLH